MKRTFNQSIIATGLLLGAIACAPGQVFAQADSTTGASVNSAQLNSQEATLVEVFDLLQKQHVDPVDPQKLLNAAVQGMIGASGDPYTDYFTPEEYQSFQNQVNLQYSGIGINVKHSTSGSVEITDVMTGEPAATAGLQIGDVIVSVNGRTVFGMTDQDVSNIVLGQAGTKVTVVVSRHGKLLPPFIVVRAQIQLKSVFYQMTKDGLGYISIYDFADNTAAEFSKALSDLSAQGAKGIIIDLRGNPGGLIDQALQIADGFLHSGEIFSVKDANGVSQKYNADANASDLPLAIVVNKGSASAAEALAGSLQALHRATLIGTKTFGKGTMQVPVTLPDGSVLKLTVAKYYFANGFNPHGIGLTPDTFIDYPSLQYNEAVQLLEPTRKETIRYTIGSPTITLNNAKVDGPVAVKRDGSTYLPLRFTEEAFGNPVQWKPDSNQISIATSGRMFNYSVATNKANIDGKSTTLHHPIVFIGGLAYLSDDEWSSLFGIEVNVSGTSVTAHPSN